MPTLVKISPLLLLAACTFDSSALGSKDECRADAECTNGACVDGTCELPDVSPDVGVDTPVDIPLADAPDPCDGADQNACGGCGTLDLAPGSPCPDSCGTLWCGADRETLVCESTPPNSCGGCVPLGANPGDSCDVCGEWRCDGADALRCENTGPNACGGCEELDAVLTESCGACDGDWMCDGENDIVCVGGETDACGTCDGPTDVAEGDVCACEGEFPARWACAGSALVCDDGADSVEHPVDLGSSADNSTVSVFAEGSLYSGEDTDWFVVDVHDSDDLLDGLYPTLVASAVPADRRICAFWQYDDRREWRLRCSGDSIRGLIEGSNACCIFGGSEGAIEIMQDVVAFERLDDILNPGAAAGTLHVGVEAIESSASQSCRTYQLELHF